LQHRRAAGGAAAERIVEQHLKACETTGLCVVRRVGTPMKVSGRGRAGVVSARLTGKSTVDYLGTLAGGRLLAIEVKSIAPKIGPDGRLVPQRFPFSMIEDHQVEDLEAFCSAGGAAMVIVVHGPDLYAVPWTAICDEKAAGGKSLSPAKLAPWRHRPGLGSILAHWVGSSWVPGMVRRVAGSTP
jgi:penicillin-binding protein-related factor A (putative recombinase)